MLQLTNKICNVWCEYRYAVELFRRFCLVTFSVCLSLTHSWHSYGVVSDSCLGNHGGIHFFLKHCVAVIDKPLQLLFKLTKKILTATLTLISKLKKTFMRINTPIEKIWIKKVITWTFTHRKQNRTVSKAAINSELLSVCRCPLAFAIVSLSQVLIASTSHIFFRHSTSGRNMS